VNINLVHNKEAASIENYENILTTEINKIAPNICTNVAIHNTLNYLTGDDLGMLIGKMRHGGTISIVSSDVMELAGALYLGHINTQQFSSFVVDNKAQYSVIDIKNFFESNGYVVESANVDNLHFNLKAKRP
jgi:hypothetical protein